METAIRTVKEIRHIFQMVEVLKRETKSFGKDQDLKK